MNYSPPLLTCLNQPAASTKRSRDGRGEQLIIRICKKGMNLLFLLHKIKDNFITHQSLRSG